MSEVAPSQASLDSADVRLRYSVLTRDGALRTGIRANCQNLTGGKLDVSVREDARTTPLGYHVAGVVRGGPQEQMIDVQAGWSVALMASQHAIWDWSARRNPGQPMRALQSAIPLDQAISAVGETLADPQCAALRIWRSGVVRKNLRKRPMTGATESFSLFGSHYGTSSAVLGQGRCRRFSVARPEHYTAHPLQ